MKFFRECLKGKRPARGSRRVHGGDRNRGYAAYQYDVKNRKYKRGLQMQKLNSSVTDSVNFYMGTDPYDLVRKYGSPLYVYNENILRERCREMKKLCADPDFKVYFSIKANSNPSLLKIIRSEGIYADAVSRGEIFILLHSGYAPDEIFFVANNVSEDEIKYALDNGIMCSADSLSMLEKIGKIRPGTDVAVRFDPGVGLGHHKKVMTAGDGSKFGINPADIGAVKELLKKYELKLAGINQHLGSLFLESGEYIKGVESLLSVAEKFLETLEFIDLGGGFGIPYRKQAGEKRLDLNALGKRLDAIFDSFNKKCGKKIKFRIEPGRYIPAECALILGEVRSVKYNGPDKFAGTDIGMNVLMRPALYDSHHDIEVYRESNMISDKFEEISVVGNICESTDFIAHNRLLPEIFDGDLIAVLDAGAYGYSMCSSYNSRPRPAEVLIRADGNVELIRGRESYERFI